MDEQTVTDPDPIKVYDARWEIDDFSDEQVRRLFEATLIYARQLRVDTITIARDARLHAGHVAEIAAEEALRAGFRVFLLPDPVSTPLSYFATLHVSQRHPATMGLTVTASHNPALYVGVKFTVPVVRAIGLDCGPQGGLTRVREIYHSDERLTAGPGGVLHVLDLKREYIDFSMRQAGVGEHDLSGMSVVLDAFHGSAGPELLAALQRAGARVEPIRIVPDGNFPTGSPNPTSRGKMDRAIELAQQRRCQVVLGVDGDGDRIVFGDARGVYSAGFAAVAILSAAGLGGSSDRLCPVLYDPKVNPLALREWTKLGVRPVLFRNGHSQIKDYMQQITAAAAAEESGHYYHRIVMGEHAVCCENSVMTVLLFLRAVSRNPDWLTELRQLQDHVSTTGEFNYRFESDDVRDRALDAVVDHFAQSGATSVTATPDGIDLEGTVLSSGIEHDDAGIDLKAGWFSGYVRVATNEKSVVRSYFSADRPEDLQRIESEARHLLADTFNGRVID